jgi:hypothetical protein
MAFRECSKTPARKIFAIYQLVFHFARTFTERADSGFGPRLGSGRYRSHRVSEAEVRGHAFETAELFGQERLVRRLETSFVS